VVEQLLGAFREARPASTRQFSALACQHMLGAKRYGLPLR
jgi:hypothetical protein